MSDAALRKSLIRLAHANPNLRADILPLLKAGYETGYYGDVPAGSFDPEEIGEEVPGAEGIADSDADKPWAKDHFTQEKFVELVEKQEAGELSDGEADITKTAAASDLQNIMEQLDTAIRAFSKWGGDNGFRSHRGHVVALNSALSDSWRWVYQAERAMQRRTAAEFADGHGPEIAVDATPASKDQNKPETWDGLTPRGVQASDVFLRKNIIRLAAAHPEFQSVLLPVLKS